jgi:tripartite-type tricarboxylate transporter receptor subunit TctC
MQLPEVRESLIKGGAWPTPGGPEEFDAVMRSDVRKIQKIVKDAKLKLDS